MADAMNIVLYTRVSSDRQADKGLSISAQLRHVKSHAAERGYVVLKVFTDEGISGTTDRRPGFQEMMRFCKLNHERVDAVLVWKFNRFSRDRVDAGWYKRYLRKLGIDVISITEPITRSIDSDVMEAVVEAMDERYTKSLAQDVMRGMAELARRGFYPLSMAPYGCQRVKVLDGKAERFKLAPDEEHAPIVRRIFAIYTTEGIGAKAIAKRLNAEGLRTRTGKLWTVKAILAILRNQAYVGTLRMEFTTKNAEYLPERDRVVAIEDAFEAIVEKQTFVRAQGILEERSRTSPKALASHYLLSGIARCGECGKRLYGMSAKSGRHHYYACETYIQSGKAACSLGLINCARLDGIVVEKVREVLLEPTYLEDLVDEVNQELGDRDELIAAELRALDATLREKKEQIERLLDAIESSKEQTIAILPRLEARQEEFSALDERRRQLEEERQSPRVLRVEIARVLPYVESLKTTLQTAPVKTQRFILKSFIKRIEVTTSKIVIDFSIPEEEHHGNEASGGVLSTV